LPPLYRPFTDYPAFSATCAKALKEERGKNDFMASISAFRGFLQNQGGPMAAPKYSLFVERRFLDKLLFSEGKWLEAHGWGPKEKRKRCATVS
jgi:hypothetical protein